MARGHGGYQSVKYDPAIERWSYMRENTYQTFAFTRRATQNVMVWAILVPSTMAFLAVRYDNKFDWAGKMKGSSLNRVAPISPEAKEE